MLHTSGQSFLVPFLICLHYSSCSIYVDYLRLNSIQSTLASGGSKGPERPSFFPLHIQKYSVNFVRWFFSSFSSARSGLFESKYTVCLSSRCTGKASIEEYRPVISRSKDIQQASTNTYRLVFYPLISSQGGLALLSLFLRRST